MSSPQLSRPTVTGVAKQRPVAAIATATASLHCKQPQAMAQRRGRQTHNETLVHGHDQRRTQIMYSPKEILPAPTLNAGSGP